MPTQLHLERPIYPTLTKKSAVAPLTRAASALFMVVGKHIEILCTTYAPQVRINPVLEGGT